MTSRKPKNLKTPSSRWGEGKVHRLVKTRGGKYVDCYGPHHTNDYYGEEVDEPITCKRCLSK